MPHAALAVKPLGYEQAVALLSDDKRDIRVEILVDLLAVSMRLNCPPE